MTPDPSQKNRRPDQEPRQDWGLVLDLGIRLGVVVMIGVFGGLALDGVFGTRPLLTLVGAAAGVGMAFYIIWDVARRAMRR